MNDHGQVAIAAAGTDRTCDPITLEIVRGALRATQSEMEALIEQPQSEKDVMARGRLLLFEVRGAAAVRFRRQAEAHVRG
jgi:hypothetical protein